MIALYARRLRTIAANPIMPAPSRAIVVGSGTLLEP
jgi:hypothetical protein